MERIPVIDADGHVVETVADLKRFMPPEYQARPIAESEAWDRNLGRKLGKRNDDPAVQLADMDEDGIDVQVIFPSLQLGVNRLRETDLAIARSRAYNDWLAEFCSSNPDRLKGVAAVPLLDVDEAIREARRAVEDLGFVGIMMPTNVQDQDIGRKQFWPFYEAVEGLGAALALHGGIHMAERMHGRFEKFIAVHTVAFPFECMTALTGLMFGGIPELFPRLQIAALEGGCGWVPFLMDRMDEEFEIRGEREAPLLKAKPSEYMRSGRFYVGIESEEAPIPYVIEQLGADHLVWASDYPHWDGLWPNASRKFLEREDISTDDKRKILWDNPQRFYGFTAKVPAEAAA